MPSTFLEWFGVAAGIASILGLFLYFLPRRRTVQRMTDSHGSTQIAPRDGDSRQVMNSSDDSEQR